MTIADAIDTLDRKHHNQYSTMDKVAWLSQLDGKIYEEIYKTHLPNTGETFPESFTGYTIDTAAETELLVPYPHDYDVYISYLYMQVDKANDEYAKYNQSATMYNNAYLNFRNWFNHNHLPAGLPRFRW